MPKPETRLQRKIKLKLLERWPRAYIRKIHGNQFQNIGVADFLCGIEGYFFALEVKLPKKSSKPTPAQLLEGQKVLQAHCIFGIVRSPEEAIDLVERGLEWHAKRERKRLITLQSG